jgi:hypothetical protein
VYGLGTLGQSLAVFAGPLIAARWGWQVFYANSALLLAWAVVRRQEADVRDGVS